MAIFALTGFGLLSDGESGVRGTVALTPAGEGTVNAEVRVSPADGADDAEWLTATSWQGGGLVVDRLERIAPGVYRTTEPVPVTGEWKTMIRLHTRQRADRAAGLPARRPGDPGRGRPGRSAVRARVRARAATAPARAQGRRAGWLWAVAYGVVLAIALGFLALLAWGVHRVSGRLSRPRPASSATDAANRPPPEPEGARPL